MKRTTAMLAALTLFLGAPAKAETNVQDLNPPARVTGRLGKPLGTRLIISGVLKKYVLLVNPLEVSEIDGQKLKQPVVIQIHGKLEAREGVTYRLEGYESGEFAGPPDWLAGDTSPQQPFQFYSFFVVTKLIEPPSK